MRDKLSRISAVRGLLTLILKFARTVWTYNFASGRKRNFSACNVWPILTRKGEESREGGIDVWRLVFQFRRNFTVNLPTWWTFNRARFNEYPQNKHRSAPMIISRCVLLYQQKKERKIEELTQRTRPRCRVRDLWIHVALCPTAWSRGKLGRESLSVNIVSHPRKDQWILNNSSAFDPAIISALCFCRAIWVWRDGLSFTWARGRSTPVKCASLWKKTLAL